jgi:hypothetical protein
MADAHFEEMAASKPPVDPLLPAAAIEQADRKSLRPEPLQASHFRVHHAVLSAANQTFIY